ncbi:segregation/condensation protein A, partial [Pseudomonas sp. MWU12-2323]|nr:segregation/condensation protein A [Pseudomonas sp. MWU12-2323]
MSTQTTPADFTLTAPELPAGLPIAHVFGQPVLEVPQDLFIPPDALQVILESFEGPLDLL